MREQEFKLKPSNYYVAIIIVVSFISLVICIFLPIFFSIKCIVIFLLGIYSFRILRDALLLSSNSILSLTHKEKNKWNLHLQNKILDAELRGDSTSTNYISILRFNLKNKKFPVSCIVLKNSLPKNVYRKLLAVLRMQ